MGKQQNLPSLPYKDFYQKLRVQIQDWVNNKGKNYKYANYVLLAPDLLHVLLKLVADRRISTESRALLAIAIAYFISPVDLIPEGLVGPSGYADDVVVAVVALNRIINKDNQSVVREHWAGEEDILKLIKRILKFADDMVGSGAWEKIISMFDGSNNNKKGEDHE